MNGDPKPFKGAVPDNYVEEASKSITGDPTPLIVEPTFNQGSFAQNGYNTSYAYPLAYSSPIYQPQQIPNPQFNGYPQQQMPANGFFPEQLDQNINISARKVTNDSLSFTIYCIPEDHATYICETKKLPNLPISYW